MVICLPITRDGQVDARWGRAGRVAVAEVREGAVVAWQEFDVGWDRLHDETAEGGHHARIARFLRNAGVETVVASHMGGQMAHMLDRMGIRVSLGNSGDARQAAMAASATH